MYLDFTTWLPDADPHAPGIVTDVVAMQPTSRGMKAAASLTVSEVTTTLSGDPSGAFLYEQAGLDTQFIIASTTANIYRSSVSGWADISGSTTYVAASAASPWRFATLGDEIIAVQQENRIRTSNAGAAFTIAAATATLSAEVVCTALQQALIFNYQEGGTHLGDGWRASALGSASSWTLNAATQCVGGRLSDTPGPVRAAREFQSNVLAFKRNAMHLGVYQGPPVVWSWQVISRAVGCFTQECIVEADNTLYWWGFNGCWRYDGSRPVRVSGAPVDYVRRDHKPKAYYLWKGLYDPIDRVIRWYYSSAANVSTLTTDKCIVFHPESGRWGKHDVAVSMAMHVTTFIDQRDPEVIAGTIQNRQVKAYKGTAETSGLTTGFIGDPEVLILLRNTRLRYITAPDTAVAVEQWRNNTGVDLTEGETRNEAGGKFDLSNEARWHQFEYTFTGDLEIVGMSHEVAGGASR